MVVRSEVGYGVRRLYIWGDLSLADDIYSNSYSLRMMH